MVDFEVGPMESGKKVQRLVRQLLPGVPLSGIHKMLRTGRVKLNGKKAKPDSVVAVGDVIRLFMAESDYETVRKQTHKFGGVSRDVDILYEDDACLAVNKPIGLLVHGDMDEQKDTLVNRVLALLYDEGRLDDSPFRPAPVNRLDRNTSGIVLFGKTTEGSRMLADAIQSGAVQKWYIALVRGQLPERGEIHAALAREVAGRRTQVVGKGLASAKAATTRYEVVAREGGTCVARVELVTGRTHQIRAHFEHLGCPLWGDVKYGGSAPRRTVAEHGSSTGLHQWLHAMWVRLPNGVTLHAPIPETYVAVLKRLGYGPETIQSLNESPV